MPELFLETKSRFLRSLIKKAQLFIFCINLETESGFLRFLQNIFFATLSTSTSRKTRNSTIVNSQVSNSIRPPLKKVKISEKRQKIFEIQKFRRFQKSFAYNPILKIPTHYARLDSKKSKTTHTHAHIYTHIYIYTYFLLLLSHRRGRTVSLSHAAALR